MLSVVLIVFNFEDTKSIPKKDLLLLPSQLILIFKLGNTVPLYQVWCKTLSR